LQDLVKSTHALKYAKTQQQMRKNVLQFGNCRWPWVLFSKTCYWTWWM